MKKIDIGGLNIEMNETFFIGNNLIKLSPSNEIYEISKNNFSLLIQYDYTHEIIGNSVYFSVKVTDYESGEFTIFSKTKENTDNFIKIPYTVGNINYINPLILSGSNQQIKITEIQKPYYDISGSNALNKTVVNSGYIHYFENKDKPTIFSTLPIFTSSMVGGEIHISNIQYDSSSLYVPSPTFNSKITNIISENIAYLSDVLVLSSSNVFYKPTSFKSASYEITYSNKDNVIITENTKSYAYVEINDISPLIGNVSYINSYVKSNSSIDDYEILSQVDLNSNLLLNGFVTVNKPNSLFFDYGKPSINALSYYTMSLYDRYNNVEILSESELILTSSFGNSFYLSSSNLTNKEIILQLSAQNTSSIGDKYTFEFDYYVTASSLYGSDIDISISTVNEGIIGSITKNEQKFSTNFKTVTSGSIDFIIKVRKGELNLKNLSITPYKSKFTSLNSTRFLLPLNNKKINDALDFKFELLNDNNQPANTFLTSSTSYFSGSNTYIEGTTNIMTGSLYVSNGSNKGVHIEGNIGGGFIKSIGYKTFESASLNESDAGFVIYSGSYANGYQGVGIEIAALSQSNFNYLRFATNLGNKSIFEVGTDSFFLGRAASSFGPSYISGSNGNLEMASNSFLLTPNGGISGSFMYIIRKTSTEKQVVVDTDAFFVNGANITRQITSVDDTSFSSVSPTYTLIDTGNMFLNLHENQYQFNMYPVLENYSSETGNAMSFHVTMSRYTGSKGDAAPSFSDTGTFVFNVNTSQLNTQFSASGNLPSATCTPGLYKYTVNALIFPGASTAVPGRIYGMKFSVKSKKLSTATGNGFNIQSPELS